MQEEWQGILQHMKEWAHEAGEMQIRSLEQPYRIKQKSADIDLVTEIDEWTDHFFKTKIKESYPDHGILTEESGEEEGISNYQWVIDPIDGTTNFVHEFPMFCISVAVKYMGETVIGLVYLPKLSETYEAVKGQGALLNGKPIIVSPIDKLTKSIVATGFPYDRATDPMNNVEYFNQVVTKVGGIRRTGSAAIDLCQVAAGRFDGYWEFKLNPWDFEAGFLIVKEAGGRAYKEKQEKGYFILVGNDVIFTELEHLLDIKCDKK